MAAAPPYLATPRARPPRPPRRDVAVKEVVQITPRAVRIVATGNLAAWPAGGPGAHFKIFLPMANGGTAIRTYTVRRYDRTRAELTIDFALDSAGPASAWASAAKPGDRFQVSGQARGSFIPGGPLVIAADQAALPATATIVEQAPPGTSITALIEVPDAAEEQPLETAADLNLQWLDGSDQGPGAALLTAMETLGNLGPGVEVWVGAEATAMRRIRRHLLEARGLAPSALYTRAYWRAGTANHSDHDTGEDELSAGS